MLDYIIIDDEPLAHELIEGYCDMLPQLNLKKHCYNAMEALEFLSKESVDLIFLDLNMPKLKGFDFLRALPNPPKVIVTTAYKEFALEGYELNIVDYLLKPFSFNRFTAAINKLTQTEATIKEHQPTKSTHISSSRFFIKGDKKQHQIHIPDILYIEAYGNYTKIFLINEMLITHEKISYFENLLSSHDFLRVHKSFIVAVAQIKAIEGNRIVINDIKIPIGQTYKSQVTKLY
ncbi:LytR/AlgR family response regulator transcription factor [Aquimarina rhabdastrellae]